MSTHEPGEEYAGPGTLRAGDQDAGGSGIVVEVTLRGHFEPIDGRFHWYGRLGADPAIDRTHRAGTTVELRTPHGCATGRLSDLDPWGRFRITGTGRPPF